MVIALFLLVIGPIKAQYSVLLNFDVTNGAGPYGSLTLSGSRLYGMTSDNTLFVVDTNGNGFTNILLFTGPNGSSPRSSLILSGKVLYGMTEFGGLGYGTIFSIDTNGANFNKLWNFYDTSGDEPYGALALSGKTLYGTTGFGAPPHQYGNIFKIDTDGSNFKVLLYFNSLNGSYPFCSLVILGNTMFGTTSKGGANGDGSLFSIKTDGSGYKDMHDFNGTNGRDPVSSLTYYKGILYGTTEAGGFFDDGCVFSIDTNGNIFKDILDFNVTNGLLPHGSLSISGKKLFGMTYFGGNLHDSGCIFQVDTNGMNYKELFNFNGTDGANPYGDVMIYGNSLYGMTQLGGTDSHGVIFKLDTTNIGNSVHELSLNSQLIKVFPNPSNGVFTISFSHAEFVSASQTIVEVYNVLGEKVLKQILRFPQDDNLIRHLS